MDLRTHPRRAPREWRSRPARAATCLLVAALSLLVAAGPVFACTNEVVRLEDAQAAPVVVLGRVTSTGSDGLFTVDVERFLKGSGPHRSYVVHDSAICPMPVVVGTRVLAAMALDGTVVSAWMLRADGIADGYGWLTDPSLSTVAAVLTAFGSPPDTAVESPPWSAADPPLAIVLATGLGAFLAVLARAAHGHRRRSGSPGT